MSDLIAEVFKLSPAEKLQLVEDLWDDLAASAASVPFTRQQLDEWDRRRRKLEDDRGAALTWDQIVGRIRERHGR